MRAIISGGGSGGHIFPALAIADKIMEKESDSDILYIGMDMTMEGEIVPEHGYNFEQISGRWFEKSPVGMLKLSSAVLKGISKSRRIIRKFNPDCVIGTGGYVSFPVIIASRLEKVPCYIHEQNAFPGSANRHLERFVNKVFLAYPEATSYFKQPQKHVYTGNPVRKEFFTVDKENSRKKLGISKDSFHILMMGGSLGARAINLLAEGIIDWLKHESEYSLSFITGNANYEDVNKELLEKGLLESEQIDIIGFSDNMPELISAADLIISRAGALSMSEINVAGKPSILIPFPWAADNHQYYNAKSVADRGGAILIEEKDINLDKIIDIIKKYKNNPEELEKMGELSLSCSTGDATEKIWDHIAKRQ